MRLVGTQALGVIRVPDAVVVPPVGDLAAAVRPRVRTLVHVLVRLGAAALRTCRPVAAGMVAALRVRPVVPLAGAARTSGRLPAGGPRRFLARIPAVRISTPQTPTPQTPTPQTPTAQTPTAQTPTAQTPTAQTPAVPSPRTGEHDLPGRRHEVELPADPTGPRRARALLRAATQDWNLGDDLYEDAAMVVTELVANAVDHAGTPSTLIVDLDDRGLYVAVRDGCADRAPRPRPVDPTAPRGRGLQMIDALTASWGVTVHAEGKTVWAVLRRGSEAGA